ncbi:Guanine nucleotide-binding protein subunit beta [Vitis vinifera]|uniref:Guanine nucleotide-binding protein subunit beta n=1 Tax=Vitis vinifera TaxID=29760 RepID=A0A438CU21_VITVI|nr:Guanine nucleotide-binding protein subunit beta [Vitis vinifera]
MLRGHKGYVSSCRYAPDKGPHLVTSSSDWTRVLRDITARLRAFVFEGEFQPGHTADVLIMHTFQGHEGDVGAVRVSPDGNESETGSNVGTCRLFDIKTGHRLQVFHQQHDDDEIPYVISIVFSISGRYLSTGHPNDDC